MLLSCVTDVTHSWMSSALVAGRSGKGAAGPWSGLCYPLSVGPSRGREMACVTADIPLLKSTGCKAPVPSNPAALHVHRRKWGGPRIVPFLLPPILRFALKPPAFAFCVVLSNFLGKPSRGPNCHSQYFTGLTHTLFGFGVAANPLG